MNQNLQHQVQKNLKAKKIHFIGIGGIGMSALARYFFSYGAEVSGSDKEYTSLIETLKKEGIQNIWIPHNKKNIEKINPSLVIYSTAINDANEEIIWSKTNNKETMHRSELLKVAISSKKLIAISGTHGKTSTTAMILEILENSKLNPSCILGGVLMSKGSNVVIGKGDYFVIEADESDKSLLNCNPDIAVITNIEEDHLENYKDGIEEIKKSFLLFAQKGYKNKGLIACLNDKNTREVILNNFNIEDNKIISYGAGLDDDKLKIKTAYNKSTNEWEVFVNNKLENSIRLKINSDFYAQNMLAAYGTALMLDIDKNTIKKTIENFQGVERRFQIVGTTGGATIVDDYAHHPTEIKATIQAAKNLNPKRLIVVLQPHHPVRVRDLYLDFVKCLQSFDDPIYVTDIYVARGTSLENINSKNLVEDVNKPNVRYLPGSIEDITEITRKLIVPGDLLLIMGAGNITLLAKRLMEEKPVISSYFKT